MQLHYKLDPRIKILLCLLVNIPIYGLLNKNHLLIFIIWGIGLLLINHCYKSILKIVVVYGMFYLLKNILPYLPDFFSMFLGMVIMSFEMFFPFIIYGTYLLKTTTINEIAASLDQMKLPNWIIIPFLVVVRFFPTINMEYIAIKNSMKLRGITSDLKNMILHPINTIEYLAIPLLFVLIKTAEELTVAALTRGLGINKQRTYLVKTRFKLMDVVIISTFIGLIYLSFQLKGV